MEVKREGEEGTKVSGEKQECHSSKTPESRKGKSCKGTLYFSSTLKSKGKNPLCIGFPATLQQVPDYVVGQSEAKATKNGRNLAYFKYVCAGYSMYLDPEGAHLTANKKPRPELPVCAGLEFVVVDKRPVDHQVPAHAPTREGAAPQPRPQKTTQHMGEEFLNRFTRNAGLVASGVTRNMSKVGNYIKESVDDILYKRPKG